MIASSQVSLANIQACPHRSLSPSHYRVDGTCGCVDPTGQLQAIVVTVEGTPARRYVVVDNYDYFRDVPSGNVPEAPQTPCLGPEGPGTGVREPAVSDVREYRERHLGRFHFGCRWVRSLGRVDEMYRTLGTWEIIKVERLPYERVWGKDR